MEEKRIEREEKKLLEDRGREEGKRALYILQGTSLLGYF